MIQLEINFGNQSKQEVTQTFIITDCVNERGKRPQALALPQVSSQCGLTKHDVYANTAFDSEFHVHVSKDVARFEARLLRELSHYPLEPCFKIIQ